MSGFSLHSYVVARDFGFAPNPFGGVCTLATCKPRIRSVARLGDWIVGTNRANKKASRQLIFAMKVGGILTFTEYWNAARFACKKPTLNGSMKRAFGDNIYLKIGGGWIQANSHHSMPDGTPNESNVERDTSVDRVLWGAVFGYWGGAGPVIPQKFRDYGGIDLCARRGHQNAKLDGMKGEVVVWLQSLGLGGYMSEPTEWQWANKW